MISSQKRLKRAKSRQKEPKVAKSSQKEPKVAKSPHTDATQVSLKERRARKYFSSFSMLWWFDEKNCVEPRRNYKIDLTYLFICDAILMRVVLISKCIYLGVFSNSQLIVYIFHDICSM